MLTSSQKSKMSPVKIFFQAEKKIDDVIKKKSKMASTLKFFSKSEKQNDDVIKKKVAFKIV